MESDAHELMAEMERAEAAPYVHYPPTPWWCAPYFGLYFVGLIVAGALDHTAAYIGGLVVLLGSLFVVLRIILRRNGVLPMPGRGNPPREIARMYRLYFLTLIPVGAVLVAAWLLLPTAASAAIAFVVVTAGFLVYDRAYGRAAAAVRERLA